MISEEKMSPVGKILKPHSYKGEMKVEVYFNKDIFQMPETPFFIKIDNILVPFFVDSIGRGSDKFSYLKLEGIDSDAEADKLKGKEIYTSKSSLAQFLEVEEEDLDMAADDYEGFTVIDSASGKTIGMVDGIEEGVEYDYLSVKQLDGEKTIDIPFIDEFIEKILENPEGDGGEIIVVLPEGFLEI